MGEAAFVAEAFPLRSFLVTNSLFFIACASVGSKALSLDPDNIQALLNKAGLKLFLGKKEEAQKFLKEVIRRDNNNEQAKYLLKNITKN